MISRITLAALVATVQSGKTDKAWDYLQNGADWPKDFPACGKENQSPIDLSFMNFEKIQADKVTRYY